MKLVANVGPLKGRCMCDMAYLINQDKQLTIVQLPVRELITRAAA